MTRAARLLAAADALREAEAAHRRLRDVSLCGLNRRDTHKLLDARGRARDEVLVAERTLLAAAREEDDRG